MSLIITLNASREDTFWNFFYGPGYRVLVFNENEYPDTLSGGVIESQVLPGTETFLRVDPITIEADTNILTFGEETRGCLYPSERPNRYGGDYTRSSCILNCRIRSVVALCGCVPFYLYVNTYLPNNMEMPPVCTLQNVGCLAKYKIKWQTVIIKIMDVVGLEKEMEESLYCPECLPSCSRISYSVQSTSLPLLRQNKNSTIFPYVNLETEFSLNPNYISFIFYSSETTSQIHLISLFFEFSSGAQRRGCIIPTLPSIGLKLRVSPTFYLILKELYCC